MSETQAVLLCAEDDDLELVQIVHLARQAGLELEVVAGVEVDDGPLTFSQRVTARGLFVILRSDNLSQERARELKSTFERNKNEQQHLLALRLDPAHPSKAVDAIRRRLDQLDGVDRRPSVTTPILETENPPTGPLMIDGDDGDDEPTLEAGRAASMPPRPAGPELETTVPQLAEAGEDTVRGAPVSGANAPWPRSEDRRRRWLLGIGLLAMMAAGATSAYLTWFDPPQPAEAPGAPAPAVIERDGPETLSSPSAEGDGASAPTDPASPRTSKRAGRHRG